MLELQSCSLQQPRDLFGSNGRVLDNEPVNVLYQHQSMRHPGELGYLFWSAIRRRDYVQRFRCFVQLHRRFLLFVRCGVSTRFESRDLRIVLAQLEDILVQMIY